MENMCKEIKVVDQKYYRELMKSCERPINHEQYRIVWVDANIFNKENIIYMKVLADLGYHGFKAIDSADGLEAFLKLNHTKGNILVISSGSMTKHAIPIII